MIDEWGLYGMGAVVTLKQECSSRWHYCHPFIHALGEALRVLQVYKNLESFKIILFSYPFYTYLAALFPGSSMPPQSGKLVRFRPGRFDQHPFRLHKRSAFN
jgi:hypothetical protein